MTHYFNLKTLPLTTNKLYAHVGRHRFLTKAARDNKESMGWEIRSQYHGDPISKSMELDVDVTIYWPNKRRRDTDNIKALLDSMTGIVFEDDSQISDLHSRRRYDKEEPCVVISVRPAGEKFMERVA